ncbi:hypothetical protein OIU78_025268 [Salix suchowensis]|nr:hypothetical protein OIU78_025268 [Salix suchowensis]
MKKLKKTASMGSKRRRTTKHPGSSSSSTEQSECLVAQLPQALIIDILSRLPISSGSNEYKVLQTFFPDKDITAAPCLAEIYTVEQFKLVALPPASQIHDGVGLMYPSSVGVIKGCLFMTNGVCMEDEKFEIWVMEEYGIVESWSKKFVLSNLEVQHSISYQPLYFLSSGQILLCEDHESIGVYVPNLERIHEDKFYKGKDSFLVTVHNPSFVSLQDISKVEELKVLRKSLNRTAAAIDDNQNVRVDSYP